MTQFQFVLALGVLFLAGAWADSRGQATATNQVTQAAGQEISAHAFPGNDLGTKIQAALASLGPSGKGTIGVTESGNISSTIVLPATSAIRIKGAGHDGTKLTWTGPAGGTMFDATATGEFQLSDLRLDGARTAGTAIKTSTGTSQRYFDRLEHLHIERFTGIVVDTGLGRGTSDSLFYDVKIIGGEKGMVIGLQNISCYFCDIQYQSVVGVELGGNSKVSFFGGHISGNVYDVRMGAGGAEFFGTWFENSISGLLTVPTPVTLLSPLAFYNCFLGTTAKGSIINTTNLSGSLILVGNRVGPSAGSANVVLSPTLQENLIRSNVGLTFSGSTEWGTATEPRGLTVNTSGAGAQFFGVHDTTPSAPNPSKWMRVAAGCLEILNDAKSAVIGRICDQGGWSAPSLSVSSGVNANAGGIKHGRTAINNCPASGCEATVTWGTAFANAEYNLSCTLEEPVAQSKTAGLRLAHIRTKTASAITVDFDNLSAGPGKRDLSLHCHARLGDGQALLVAAASKYKPPVESALTLEGWRIVSERNLAGACSPRPG